MAGNSPEDWVGQDVVVEVLTSEVDYQVVARLEGVNDWGIVLNEAEPVGGDIFYPRRLVVAMRLASEEDLSTPPGYLSPQDSTR